MIKLSVPANSPIFFLPSHFSYKYSVEHFNFKSNLAKLAEEATGSWLTIGGILLLLLLEEPVGTSKGGGDDEDDEEDLATIALGFAGLELGLERLDLFAAILVHGVTAKGGVLNEARAQFLGLELSVVIVVGAAGVLSAKTTTGIRDLLASQLVVRG
jgi:hypothetical protein